MRVTCKEKNSWLTIGQSYLVLELLHTMGKTKYRLMTTKGDGVALFSSELFEITQSRVSSFWIFSMLGNDAIILTTEVWNREGYWELFYDRDKAAIELFKEEFSKLDSE